LPASPFSLEKGLMTAFPQPAPRRILVTPRSLTAAGVDSVEELAPLRDAGFELVASAPGRAPSEAELLDLVPGCVGWVAGVERVSREVLEAATGLRVISRNGTGTDNIDVEAAEAAGIEVRRAAGANAQGVAELALTLALSALRSVPWSADALRRGEWRRWQGRELADSTVGVVGLGAIGRKVASMFTALGAGVVGYDPFADSPEVTTLDLRALLAASNVVTLHAPPPAGGGALIGAAELRLLPEGAVLINTARASLVDDDAVLSALESGRLAAYAVDAFETEPPEPSALLRHERVLATPHIGAFTGASIRRATSQAVHGVLDVLRQPQPEGTRS
jgi:D-3-phosphoglycerate dehydrogenase